ncbi:hypothetical protein ACJMK2_026753 [Sinanodonta woodiana]|uniref:MD-2-related lipid-recognition domain-containing protein n=1 Tax=Sinanodonta woodiana TaxID=1069815 RepID=A0ABD3XP87_SINWO
MNVIVLLLLSQTLSTSLSKAETFNDFLKEVCSSHGMDSQRPSIEERGYMQNCYPNSSYNISWVPKDINPHESLKFFINYTLPADFESGEYSVHINFKFIHISKTLPITCKGADVCPVKKGDSMAFWCEFRDIIRFKNFEGFFKLMITAGNEHGENMLCGTLEANLL